MGDVVSGHFSELMGEIGEKDNEIRRLRGALKDLFLLACASNDIRPDCRQMRAAGKLLAKAEGSAVTGGSQ